MSAIEKAAKRKIIDLATWEPSYKDIYYIFDGECVIANYSQHVGLTEEKCTLPIFYIKKSHYKKKIIDIVQCMNYFTKFYDLDRDTYFATMSLKYLIDTTPDMTENQYLEYLMERIITPNFIRKCKMMSNDLYTININTDDSGKFKNTPKITNAQAKQIVAISFCFKLILPLCIHFSNMCTNTTDTNTIPYLDTFSGMFIKIIKRFELDDTPFFASLSRFVMFRVIRIYKNNLKTFDQKKMIRGDTPELFCEKLIKEVISVKTLYKLDYRRSCVSFIDGVVHFYEGNYLIENYFSKPYEVDSSDTSRDSDDSLSHAEALEMAAYVRDASSIMISDCNRKRVINEINDWYKAFNITDEEIQFYVNNCKLNEVSIFLLNSFYSGKFKDSYAIFSLNKIEISRLICYMKKYLEYHMMPLLAQILTATVTGRYKSNIIKNNELTESIYSSNIYKDIIARKFEYVIELNPKENPIIRWLSNIANCEFTFVDMDTTINNKTVELTDIKDLAYEFLLFLSIV